VRAAIQAGVAESGLSSLRFEPSERILRSRDNLGEGRPILS